MVRRIFFLMSMWAGIVSLAGAQTNPVAQAAACVKDLEEQIGVINQAIAGATNSSERAACLASKKIKVQALLEMAQTAKATLMRAEMTDGLDAAETSAELARLDLARTRAEKVTSEIDTCRAIADSPEKPVVVTNTPTSTARESRPQLAPLPMPSGLPVRKVTPRDVNSCISQGDLACLLIQRMELKVKSRTAPACMAALAKLNIQPFDGWQAGACVTLDDFYVLTSRALGLQVDHPEQPENHARALRMLGMPVDTVLPPRGDFSLPPPLVIESEARQFLIEGIASPPASARQLDPD